jgi:hypothetical protein
VTDAVAVASQTRTGGVCLSLKHGSVCDSHDDCLCCCWCCYYFDIVAIVAIDIVVIAGDCK